MGHARVMTRPLCALWTHIYSQCHDTLLCSYNADTRVAFADFYPAQFHVVKVVNRPQSRSLVSHAAGLALLWLASRLKPCLGLLMAYDGWWRLATAYGYKQENEPHVISLRVLRLTFLPAWLTNFVAACGLARFMAAYGGLRKRFWGLVVNWLVIIYIFFRSVPETYILLRRDYKLADFCVHLAPGGCEAN